MSEKSSSVIVSCNSEIDKSSSDYNFLETAIYNAVRLYLEKTDTDKLQITVSYGDLRPQQKDKGTIQPSKDLAEDDMEKRIDQYVAEPPKYSFKRLIVNEDVRSELMQGVRLFEFHDLIYNKWGLKQNTPYPVVALNFYGPTGTGKTLAAHAIASYLKKNVIIASYAQIESMYHGEGPKNVEALFKAAEKQDAVLFIDEADSLLSKRLTNVRQGSENAINSMRSQILICLEKFNGIVIFATNLVKNYDRAFESRVRSIEFKLPDEKCRKLIWELHLPKTFPVDESVSIDELAKIDDVCGREIRNAVQNVAEKMAVEHLPCATMELFGAAIDRIKKTRFKESNDGRKEIHLTDAEKKDLTDAYKEVEQKSNELKAAREDG